MLHLELRHRIYRYTVAGRSMFGPHRRVGFRGQAKPESSYLELEIFNPTGDERLRNLPESNDNESRHFGRNFRRNAPLINNLLIRRSFASPFSLFFFFFFSCRRDLAIESNSITRNETCCSGISPARQPQLLFQSITRSAADRPAESNTFHARRSMISTRESRSSAVQATVQPFRKYGPPIIGGEKNKKKKGKKRGKKGRMELWPKDEKYTNGPTNFTGSRFLW